MRCANPRVRLIGPALSLGIEYFGLNSMLGANREFACTNNYIKTGAPGSRTSCRLNNEFCQ